MPSSRSASPSFDVMKEQLGEALVILAQGRERSVEFLACGGEPLVVLLKAFQPLLEVRVHVVAVYEPRVDLSYMAIARRALRVRRQGRPPASSSL